MQETTNALQRALTALNQMSDEDLMALKRAIDNTFETRKEARRATLLREARYLAGQMGVPLEEVLKTRTLPEPSSSVRVESSTGGGEVMGEGAGFRNPDNPQQVWSGRGRRPVWFIEAVARGVDPEAMRMGGEGA
ncbi:MAG: H-NS histone family protein [Halothiobacillaceae bacterium]|nr:H-NS histone family protein [Halothiobacillaceae bacterium]